MIGVRWLASWLGDWSEAGCPAGWLDSNVVACLPACLNKGLGCYQDAAKKLALCNILQITRMLPGCQVILMSCLWVRSLGCYQDA